VNFALRLGLFVATLLPALSCFAGARHFTYLYEAPTSPPGSFELENTVTWARTTGSGMHLDEVAFREELEIGITDHFQLGIYPLDWGYHHDRGQGSNEFSYEGGAVELIYNLSNPVIDPVGLSLYQEISIGRQRLELESKVIAQKNFGRLILDYNATLEAEWEGKHLEENNGELQQALGASYEVSPQFSVGIELLHEFVFPGWQDKEKLRNVFVGPNVAVRRRNWFITVTALAQATDTDDEPEFQVRTIFGFGL
jgi:hypothetical protein